MHSLFFMAVHTGHSYIEMHILYDTVLAGEFRIDPTTMTKTAGFFLFASDKPMPFQQSGAYLIKARPFDMAIAASGMAVSAGLLENRSIKCFDFPAGKSPDDPLAKTRRGIMKRRFVRCRDIFVAATAAVRVIRRATDQTDVRRLPCGSIFVALVTKRAPLFKMRVIIQHVGAYDESLVDVFHPDRGENPSSAFTFILFEFDLWRHIK